MFNHLVATKRLTYQKRSVRVFKISPSRYYSALRILWNITPIIHLYQNFNFKLIYTRNNHRIEAQTSSIHWISLQSIYTPSIRRNEGLHFRIATLFASFICIQILPEAFRREQRKSWNFGPRASHPITVTTPRTRRRTLNKNNDDDYAMVMVYRRLFECCWRCKKMKKGPWRAQFDCFCFVNSAFDRSKVKLIISGYFLIKIEYVLLL